MRSVISEFNQYKKIFVLFLDTFSSLSSFMPNRWLDPLEKTSETLLIEPFFLLPNWDVHTNFEEIQTPQDSLLFENICSFGRPLWGSLSEAKNSFKKYD